LFKCDACGLDDLPTQKMLDLHKERYCSALAVKQVAAPPVKETGFQITQRVGRLEVPKSDPDYFIEDEVAAEIDRVIALTEQTPQNLAVIGPKGTGKTALSLEIAARRGSPTYLANAYSQRSSDEWFGREMVNAEVGTYYEPSLFVEAVETEGATVILNDFALMQNKSVQNGLNDLLDDRVREAWIDPLYHATGKPLRVAAGVLFIATWNEGSEYTGNIKLSANILDRFANRIYMPYPPADTQVEVLSRKTGIDAGNAVRLVKFAESLRQTDEPIDISMRGLLQAAKKMVMGAHIRDALYFTVISGLTTDLQTKALAALEGQYTKVEKEQVATRTPQWRPVSVR